MPSYQQQPPPAQSWDRWQQPHTSTDYTMMNGMVAYDPRTVPSTAPLQRPAITPQYNLPASYAENPVTPMSASPYGSQSHFSDYQSYTYQQPASSSSTFTQMPLRSGPRPMAPPTPPLDDERSARLGDGRSPNAARGAIRRTSRRSVSVVKPGTSGDSKEIKTCPKYIKADGSLQYESTKLVDVFLRQGKAFLEPKQPSSSASTPESMASPASEEQQASGRKGFKQYHCDICPQRFHQRAQLLQHKLSHTGEKPHQCDICGMRVTQPGNLKAHKRKHTKEKPYSCPICPAVFSANGGMKVHLRNKHYGEPKTPCPFDGCKKDFSTIGNMKVHINNFHVKELATVMKRMEEAEGDSSKPLSEKEQSLLKVLLRIYKNSNCGIKGRGAEPKESKEEKPQASKREPVPQEMTPVSPASTNTVQDYRQYYDQQHQPHYQGLPYPGQQSQQQQSGYLQSPMHQPQQPVYHGLPQPGAYNMGWAPGPQYH